MRQPHVILLGGFLGAGKTTLIASLVRHFGQAGQKVGVVTNDQADNLVDTGLLKTQSSSVREVAGACFCCSFTSFASQLKDLRHELDADFIIGEPVGSCTDLSGTVVQPLRKLYKQEFHILPYSVLVDPQRWCESRLPRAEQKFPDSVLYIYRLQIEEADAILLSKVDLLSEQELQELKAQLEKHYWASPRMVGATKGSIIAVRRSVQHGRSEVFAGVQGLGGKAGQ
jgi:G3E family GTPase